MGYSSVTSRGDLSNQLIEYIPKLKGNFSELRQWTVRHVKVQPSTQSVVEEEIRKPNPESQFDEWCSTFPTLNEMEENRNSFFNEELALPMVDWVSTKEKTMTDPTGSEVSTLFGIDIL
jgi:hypothetical protein